MALSMNTRLSDTVILYLIGNNAIHNMNRILIDYRIGWPGEIVSSSGRGPKNVHKYKSKIFLLLFYTSQLNWIVLRNISDNLIFYIVQHI